MSKYTIVIILGIWIAILPFLGFPGFWRTIFIVLSSLGIIVLTLFIKSESSNNNLFGFRNGEKKTDVYTENGINDNIEYEIKNQKKK